MPTITNGGKTYTFKLRHDVHFWNGKLATAADWVYSFNRIIDPKTQAGGASFWFNVAGASAYNSGKATSVSGIKAVDQFTLQINLNKPDASFLSVLAMPFGSVVDKDQIAKYGKTYDASHPMGTGPYMFVQHAINQKLTLTKNPHYFGGNVGKVDTIEADFGVDLETAYLRIQRGQADYDGDQPAIPPADFLNTINDPTLSKQVVKQAQVAFWYVAMNVLIKPFDNVLVRRAVNMALDRKPILRLVNGQGVVTTTILPAGMPGHGNFDLYPYDPAAAKKLLAKAGFPNGFSTVFYTPNVSDDERISQNIVQQLSQIGINAQLKVIDGNTWQTLVGTKGKVPITWTAWYQDFPDPNDFFEPILSCASAVPGTFNEPWYCNHTVDTFAQKLKTMSDQTARLAQYSALDKMVMRDAPVVPIYSPVYYVLHSASVHDFFLHNVWTFVMEDYTKS
jgi:oligopeptide transport system substrate-binding protein